MRSIEKLYFYQVLYQFAKVLALIDSQFIIRFYQFVHMHSSNAYILQLFVRKCKIKVSEAGSVGLLLRAGKNQSHVTNSQPVINGVVNFNTQIKINVDESALDTKRCTLTLNFVSATNAKRVIGIVVITIPEIGTEIEKTLKVTSTPDKDAQIELSIGLRDVNDKKITKSEPKDLKLPETRETKQHQKLKSLSPSKLITSPNSMITSLTSRTQQTPTSPPSQTTQKLNLKSKRSQMQSFNSIQHSEESLIVIEKLQREKQLLKQLLKIEMVKSATACNHLKNILGILSSAVGVGFGDGLRMTTGGIDLGMGKRFSFDTIDVKNGLSLSTPGLSVVKESRFEDFSPLSPSKSIKSPNKLISELSTLSKSRDMNQILQQLKNRLQQVGKSKTELNQIFEKMRLQPKIELDASKLRVLKTRIDKVYIPLIGKDQVTKQQILRQKIEVNRILDEVICPLVK